MKVTATERGYYGGMIREPGDVFDVDGAKAFSDKWMAKAGKSKPAEAAPVEPDPQPESDPVDLPDYVKK